MKQEAQHIYSWVAHWNGDKTVPEAIKKEFYHDYLSSSNTLEEYIRTTSSSY